MRIAQVAPMYESVPPKTYGGTERVVHYITEELVRRGHEVTLFAAGDSETKARLIPGCPKNLRSDPNVKDPLALHYLMLEKVYAMASQFDLIHFHVDYLHFPVSRRMHWPTLTTLHGNLESVELERLYHEFPDLPVVSISQAQRRARPNANWMGTVYHGLPPSLYHYSNTPEKRLVFVGRISPEKRVDRAIEVAIASGIPLTIAAKVDAVDKLYFEQAIQPLLKHSLIEFIGEVNNVTKDVLLGKATALLFPIEWNEPFGLVMIEALACGTPVVAWNRGSVPEIIENNKTGFVVNSVSEAIEAVEKLPLLSRRLCRTTFESRFLVSHMVDSYEVLYREVIDRAQRREVA